MGNYRTWSEARHEERCDTVLEKRAKQIVREDGEELKNLIDSIQEVKGLLLAVNNAEMWKVWCNAQGLDVEEEVDNSTTIKEYANYFDDEINSTCTLQDVEEELYERFKLNVELQKRIEYRSKDLFDPAMEISRDIFRVVEEKHKWEASEEKHYRASIWQALQDAKESARHTLHSCLNHTEMNARPLEAMRQIVNDM